VLDKPLLLRGLEALDDTGSETKRTYIQSPDNQRDLEVTLINVLYASRCPVAVLEENAKDEVEGMLAPII
jgi:hypothetical protein